MLSNLRTVLIIAVLALGIALIAAGSQPASAGGQTFAVNVAENAVDLPDGTCDATCTLTDAINAANASPGHDTIVFDPVEFAPPSADWIIPISPLPLIDAGQGITIDGSAGLVQIYGFEASDPAVGLHFISGPGNPISGVQVNDLTVGYFGVAIKFCGGISGSNCTYDVEKVSLARLTLTNGPAGVQIDAANVEDVTFRSITGNGIDDVGIDVLSDDGLTDLTVEDTTFVDLRRYGIWLRAPHIQSITLRGNRLDEVGWTAISIYSLAGTDVEIADNTSSFSADSGIRIDLNSANDLHIAGNAMFSGVEGVIDLRVSGPSTGIVIEGNVLRGGSSVIEYRTAGGQGNIIRGNELYGSAGSGVLLDSPTTRVTVSRNSIYGNFWIGLDLSDSIPNSLVTLNDPGDLDSGPNDLLNFPVLTGMAGGAVTGTVCANCLVELFVADNDPSGYGEGLKFLRDVVADGNGDFAVSICGLGLFAGTKVTSTATDALGNTSEFSLNYLLPAGSPPCPPNSPSPTPTTTPTAVPTPPPTATVTPAPTAMPTAVPTPPPTATVTPAPTATPTATPGGTPFPTATAQPQIAKGDLDCDHDTDAVDALKALQYVAALPYSQGPGCPVVGDGMIVDTQSEVVFGDMDCDADIDAVDSLWILKYVAALPVNLPDGCAAIGSG